MNHQIQTLIREQIREQEILHKVRGMTEHKISLIILIHLGTKIRRMRKNMSFQAELKQLLSQGDSKSNLSQG